MLRSRTSPLLLVRASDEAKTEGEATLRSVIVPLVGSKLAERELPTVVELVKQLNLNVVYSVLTTSRTARMLIPRAIMRSIMRSY